MSAKPHSNLDGKTKALIAGVALGNLIGEVVTFLGGICNITGWDVARVPCELAWAVLAFPLGWLGWIEAWVWAGGGVELREICLGVGVIANAMLWAWAVYKLVGGVSDRDREAGFDAAAVLLKIAEIRQNHVAEAHSRWKPPHARKGLVEAASRAIRRFGYFAARNPEPQDSAEEPRRA